MELRLSKGTKDYLPEEQIVRERIKSSLKCVFERFGFAPLETPIIEMRDVLTSKYAGGAEILKEMFTLTDQGGRELGLRYDLTVPLARVIGMNPELRFPFKRYEMGRVFRDGPIKLGRLREFWQCDVDVIGSDDLFYDAELIALAAAGLQELGVDAYVEVNSMKLLRTILRECNVPDDRFDDVILSLDKLKKIGESGVRAELKDKGIDEALFDRLFSFFADSDFDRIGSLLYDKEGLSDLREIFSYLERLGVDADVRFVPSLARGLQYYTGMVFEAFLKDSEMNSSVCGGGRWDGMIGDMIGRDCVPAVGFSFGLDALYAAMADDVRRSVIDAYIVPIKIPGECIRILSAFRARGVKCDMDKKGRGISKNLDFANREGIPFVVIVGPDEFEKGVVKLKDMRSGDESLLALDEAADIVSKTL